MCNLISFRSLCKPGVVLCKSTNFESVLPSLYIYLRIKN